METYEAAHDRCKEDDGQSVSSFALCVINQGLTAARSEKIGTSAVEELRGHARVQAVRSPVRLCCLGTCGPARRHRPSVVLPSTVSLAVVLVHITRPAMVGVELRDQKKKGAKDLLARGQARSVTGQHGDKSS